MKAMQPRSEFRERLRRAKSESGADFEWYRYDSLSNLAHIGDFLSEEIQAAAREKGVLDLGCGDGDLSFYFESLGYAVTSVDHPGPNHNGMRGVRLLRRALDSRIDLREADIDAHFPKFERRFGVCLLLGVLYHLKNPFYVLENAAAAADYCIMSTRIARNFPKIGRVPEGAACAYLLDAGELNRDNSNFWIFSEAGLKRVIERSGWGVLKEFSLGDTVHSDATSLERDERRFCLLRSRYGLGGVDLVSGWHEPEPGGWRWTERVFAIRPSGESIAMEIYVPPEVLERTGPLTMAIATESAALAPAIFEREGMHTVTRSFPRGAAILNFSLDKSLPPDASDGRERGLIVASIAMR
ncbi:MAG TPA: class I SAM-dependent methyltransferase [Bryobacteraceae bacterium]|jgi:tRNA (mo5U34)-methyltransferase|nr:class I SAM-dependent methyltransferase [Bryobacteraceae bacterium]